MADSGEKSDKIPKTGRLTLADGWTGLVCLEDSSGRKFSIEDWERCLERPGTILERYEKVLKKEPPSYVVQRNLSIGPETLPVAVKYDARRRGLRGWLRSLRFSRAVRNFRTARRLLEGGVQVAAPAAALYKRKYFSVEESIDINEYIDDSINLYHFLRGRLPDDRTGRYAVKRRLAEQIAGILANLHRMGRWHRDAKASNFVVCPRAAGQYEVKLVDMDGIKSYVMPRRARQLQPLWQLGASLTGLVTRSDCLRTFTLYCNLCGIKEERRRIYRRLAGLADKKWQSLRERRGVKESYKNILIIKPSSLGDVVLALPALSALRKSFPAARISWLVRPDFAPLLQDHPYLNELIPFDRKFLGKSLYNPAAFSALISLIKRLHREHFDAVFDFQGLLRTALLSRLTGCRSRYGMANARELGHLFYNHKVIQDRDCIHLVDYYLKIVKASGAKVDEVEFILPYREDAEKRAMQLLAERGVDKNNYAVFVPGSAHSRKCWPVEKFAVLADKMASQFGPTVIAVGTKLEKQTTERLKMLAKTTVTDLTCLTSIPELVALMRRARIVVSNDTGPGHIAGALGVPVVLIFGPTNPIRVAPYGRSETVVGIDVDKRGHAVNSSEPSYRIEAIEVEQVFSKVSEQLNTGRPETSSG